MRPRQAFVRRRGAGVTVIIEAQTWISSVIDPTDAYSYFQFNTAGTVVGSMGGIGTTYTYSWLPAGGGAAYEIKADLISSTGTPSGTFGSWLSMAGANYWSLGRTTFGEITADIDITIRRASDHLIVAGPTRNRLDALVDI